MPVLNIVEGNLFVRGVSPCRWQDDYKTNICPVCRKYKSCYGARLVLNELIKPDSVVCKSFSYK